MGDAGESGVRRHDESARQPRTLSGRVRLAFVRILIFGATGVLGRATIPHLAEHTIAGTTRSPGKLAALSAMGVEGFVCDAYDREAVGARRARVSARCGRELF